MERTFKFTEDNGGNWTISTKDYKESVEVLVGHDESGSKAVYAERIRIGNKTQIADRKYCNDDHCCGKIFFKADVQLSIFWKMLLQ